MMKSNKTLEKDLELFAASITQTPVSAWKSDVDGVYVMVGYGFIEKYTPKYVRIYDQDEKRRTHYDRGECMFRTEL